MLAFDEHEVEDDLNQMSVTKPLIFVGIKQLTRATYL